MTDALVDPQPPRRHLYVAFAACKRGQLGFGWTIVVTPDFVVGGGKEIEVLLRDIEKMGSYDKGSVVIINFMRMEEP